MQLSSVIEETIVSAVRTQKRSWLRQGVGVVCVGVVLAIPVYFVATPPNGGSPLTVALGTAAMFAVLGGVVALFSLGDPRRGAGLEQLRNTPAERIVWLFVSYGRGTHLAHITFGSDDGKMGSVAVLRRDAEATFQALHSHVPHAHVGFSQERMERYHRAPQAFAAQPD